MIVKLSFSLSFSPELVEHVGSDQRQGIPVNVVHVEIIINRESLPCP